MQRRIFTSMCVLIVFTVTASTMLGVLFFGEFGRPVRDELKALRVTMIAPSGEVLFDNVEDSSTLENHMNRPEIEDALRDGAGESERFSETLGETTYYYAMRATDGNILRLSLTTDGISRLLYHFVPPVLACLCLAALLALFLARRLTRGIVAPINRIDAENPEKTEGGVYDEILPFLRRIETQKRELSAQLAKLAGHELTLRAITENMREGLLLVSRNGRVLLANRSAAHLLGTGEAQEKTQGEDVARLCRDAGFLDAVKRALAGERSETTFQKNARAYGVFCNPLDDASGALILFIDVTEKHALETQRREFSANVSHELKTPLTTISALSEMIADGTAREEDMRGFGEKIRTHALRLIETIDEIIRLSEFDEGRDKKQATETFASFDARELAETVVDGMRAHAAERGVTITLVADGSGEPLTLRADRRMIDELLQNLVDNAVKYNRPGGSVTVRLERCGDGVFAVTVEDTGIGIPAGHIDRVFERFYRVDKSRSKKTGGTGLGLSIVKHIAEHHGGRVEIRSEEGVGTVVSCVI